MTKEVSVKHVKDMVSYYQQRFDLLKKEIARIVVGQEHVINALIEVLLANSHVLVEGVPGIAKTLIVRTFAAITGSRFSRIQFTPDLLPSDIIGITTYEEGRGFYTIKGPIFANFVLADEINRAPPKVQSALLEAMQERQVTIGKETFKIPQPFFVMATENPIESLGTYRLPEAQLDRFMYKVLIDYPNIDEEQRILHQNISLTSFESYGLRQILSPKEILKAQQDVKSVIMSKKVERYLLRIVDATRKPNRYGVQLGKYIDYGASPRANISLYIGAKAHALLKGKTLVTPQDIKEIAFNALRHRIILSYEGQAEEIKADQIIEEILKKVPIL